MSDSTDNTNELDSYGVWVKNTPKEEKKDDFDLTDSLDLPDFEDAEKFDTTDFSDMFKDDNQFASDTSNGDTTLTSDELQNLTDGLDDLSVEEVNNPEPDFSAFEEPVATPEENIISEPATDITEDVDLSSFDDIPIEDISETPAEASAETFEEVSFDDIPSDSSGEQEVSIDDFMSDSAPAASSSETEEISLDDFMSDSPSAPSSSGTEEVSLDDFMSDSTPAPSSSGTEEVSLDDFMDLGDFDMGPSPAKKEEEEIVDEKPLDMDISFDSSADTVQTVDNTSISNADFDDIEEEVEENNDNAAADFEDVSMDFGSESKSSGGDNFESEEIDLADFGIDANAEEKPVTQDIESAKIKDEIVDFDLSVDNDNMNAAPVVNEIKSDNTSSIEETVAETPATNVAAVSTPADTVSASLLQQIVADLNSLRDEINSLKSNIEEIKAKENKTETADSEPVIEENNEPELPVEETKDEGGFFGDGDDGDETLALSTDELNDIMNTADFSTDIPLETSADSAVEQPSVETSGETSQITEEEIPAEEEIPLETTDEIISEELPSEDLPEFIPESIESEKSEDIPETIEETVDAFEPVADTIESTETDNSFDDLPQEITIPVEDEKEAEEIIEEPEEKDDNTADILGAAALAGAAIVGTAAVASALSDNNDETETVSEEPVEEINEQTIDENVIDETAFDEPVIEETSVEETFDEPLMEDKAFEDLLADEPATEETPAATEETESSDIAAVPVAEEIKDEPAVEETFDDIFDTTITDSSIDNTDEPVFEDNFDDLFNTPDEIINDTISESPDSSVTEESIEEPAIEENTESITEEEPVFDIFDTKTEENTTAEDNFFDSVDDLITESDKPTIEDTSSEPTIVEETPLTEEPVAEESSSDETTFDTLDDFVDIPTEESLEEISEESADELGKLPSNTDETLVDEVALDSNPVEETIEDSFGTTDTIIEEEPLIEASPEEIKTPETNEDSVDSTLLAGAALAGAAVAGAAIITSNEDEDKTAETVSEPEIEVEEPVASEFGEETSVSENEVFTNTEDDLVTADTNNNSLSDSNMDYLTSKSDESEDSDNSENAELKKDIKSVLLYMDQLLENLPEEKIVEFAKSEEFATYKKLFSELGLK